MNKPQAQRMECLARKPLQGSELQWIQSLSGPRPPTVDRIPDQGKLPMGEMDPNLVSPSGFQFHPEKAVSGEPAQHPIMRHRRPPARHDSHARAMRRVTPDGRIDAPPGDDLADHQCTILAVNLMCAQLLNK